MFNQLAGPGVARSCSPSVESCRILSSVLQYMGAGMEMVTNMLETREKYH
jgi:hypothetical protein